MKTLRSQLNSTLASEVFIFSRKSSLQGCSRMLSILSLSSVVVKPVGMDGHGRLNKCLSPFAYVT